MCDPVSRRRGVHFEADPQGIQGGSARSNRRRALGEEIGPRALRVVFTPGTAADSSLGADENNFLAAVAAVG